MGFLSFLWQLHLGLLRILGNTVLILLGVALCTFTLIDQFHHLEHTQRNVVIFAAGFVLVAFAIVRRWVWMVLGLTVPWVALVAGAVYLLTHDVYRFEITAGHLAVTFVPPVLLTVVLELLPKPDITREPPRDGSSAEG